MSLAPGCCLSLLLLMLTDGWSPGVGRFVAPAIARKYDFDVPAYEGLDQVAEVGPEGLKL